MKQNLKIKCLKGLSVVVATFLMFPCVSFADGEDVNTMVRAFTYDEGGNVTKNVGNVKVTKKYSDISAAGILAESESNRTAKVTAKNVDVNVPSADYQTGVEVWSGGSAGTVNITTNNIKSGEHGIWADILDIGNKAIVTVNGNIEAGAYDTDYGYRLGRGIIANVRNGGIANVTVNGNVNAKDKGIWVSAVGDTDPSTGGTANIKVYGDVIAESTHEAALGIDFSGHTDKADVLVTGVVSGEDGGVNTDNYRYYSTGESKLTVWKIASASGKLVTKRVGSTQYGTDDEFAKKINYIIKHDNNVLPRKANGSELDIKHGYHVAKEGDKVLVDTAFDGIYAKKAYNNGVPIKTIDESGYFYVTVKRGGGIFLTIETEAVTQKLENPIKLKGKTVKVKAAALSKKAQTTTITKAIKITNAQGILSYKKKKGVKKVSIDKTTGKITIKKGLKKGKYKIVVDVTAAGNRKYKPATKSVTFTLNVK